MIKSIIILAAASLFCINSFCQEKMLKLDPGVKTGKLPNGFTYYIRQNEEPKNRVIFYLVLKAGSMQETAQQRGLAHFMEHMSFNGTKHYPKNQLVDLLQKSGVRFGADLNAYTGFDQTVYQLPLPSDNPDLLQHGLQIMRDWSQEASLKTDEINKERGVVLEEKRLHNDAGSRMMEKLLPMQMNGSLYKDRLPIGTTQVLESFKPSTLKAFYKEWYRPSLQALIVVGDINIAAMERQIQHLFSSLKNPAVAHKRQQVNIPLLGRNQFMSVTDPEQTTTTMEVAIKQAELPLKTDANYRMLVIRTLFNSILGERIRDLSQQSGISFSMAKAGVDGFMGGLDAFNLSLTASADKLKESFRSIWREVESMRRLPVDAGELSRAKKQYLSFFEKAFAEKEKTASEAYVREYVEHFLHQVAAPGIEWEYQFVQQLLPGIVAEDILSFAKSTIKDIDRDIYIQAPEKDKNVLPSETEVFGWIESISKDQLSIRKDGFAASQLMAEMPAPGSVISRHRIDSVGVSLWVLSNGAKVWIKPTTFKNDEILLSVFSEGGSSLYPDSIYQSTVAVGLVPFLGAGRYSAADLGKLLSGKNIRLQPFLQERWEGIGGETSPKDLETTLQLMHLYFTQPRKDSGIFNNIINRSREMIASRGKDPQAVLSDSSNAILGSYHYRRMPPKTEQLDSVSLDKVISTYKERFANAGDFQFVFTGSLDTTTLLPLIETYIASLPAIGEHEKATNLGIHIPSGIQQHIVYMGEENKAVVRLVYSGTYDFNPKNNVQLSALGTVLQYRITTRIREEEGGAYSPRAGVSYNKFPESRYAFNIVFTCALENVEKLVKAAQDEIEKIKRTGPSNDDIVKFVAEETRSRETGLSSNSFWDSYLTYALQNDVKLTGILDGPLLLKGVSVQSIQETAIKYLPGSNIISIIMMPKKGPSR